MCLAPKVTVRVIKLGISLWMIGDMIADGFTTQRYLQYAKDTRTSWEVSYNYYYCASAIWAVMPVFAIPGAMNDDNLKPTFLRPLRENCVLVPLYFAAGVLWYYACSVIWVYLIVPMFDIFYGARNVFCHARYKEDGGADAHAKAPAMKLFEQLGEAVPQLTLAIVFYSKNSHWLPATEIHFGIFTMALSAGSVAMGTFTGIRAARNSEKGLLVLFFGFAKEIRQLAK